jgi:glycosyltransferase involved in cell wall biosynthesis
VNERAAAALERWALKRTGARVIASSRFVAERLGVGAEVIYNGVAEHRTSGEHEGGRPWTAAVLGRVAPEKGQLLFVQAAEMVQRVLPDCRFVIAGGPMFGGSAYWDETREAAAKAGVELAGWTDDVPSFLASIDLLVVPSAVNDATPRAVLEAYSARVPVVALSSGGIPELIAGGETGVLVDDRSPESLAFAMIRMAQDPDETRRMAARAYARWEREFTLARYQSEVCEAIEDVVDRHSHRAPLARAAGTARA